MFMVILITLLAVVAIVAAGYALSNDGYRRVPTDWSRVRRP